MNRNKINFSKKIGLYVIFVVGILDSGYLLSCGGKKSPKMGVTGVDIKQIYGNVSAVQNFNDDNMVYINGGACFIGDPRHGMSRLVTLSPFFMSRYPITNFLYHEYLYWIRTNEPYKIDKATPQFDNANKYLKFAKFNDEYSQYYFYNPAFKNYPVVNISWEQANDYCEWRSDRVNEKINPQSFAQMKQNKAMLEAQKRMGQPNTYGQQPMMAQPNPYGQQPGYYGSLDQNDIYNQNVSLLDIQDNYGYGNPYGQPGMMSQPAMMNQPAMMGQPSMMSQPGMMNQPPMMGQPGMMNQPAMMNQPNSIFEESNLVKYRLPTEAEWDYVASGAHGEEVNNMLVSKQGFYPWTDGYGIRCKYGEWKGKLVANFCSMPGNYIGIPGETNKLCMLTPVDAYPPNCLGIYDKGGNVSEYVMDVYNFSGSQMFTDYDPVINTKNKKMIDELEAGDNVVVNKKEDEIIYRVYKGSNWYEPLECCEVGFRGRISEKEGCPYVGFSIVMEANTNIVEKQNS